VTVAELFEALKVAGAVSAALIAITGLIGGVLHMGWRLYVRPHLDRIEQSSSTAVDAVRRDVTDALTRAANEVADVKREIHAVRSQVAPNGHENEGHPDDAGVPLRTLVLRQGREQRHHTARLDEGADWMRNHDTEHVRRDPQWQAHAG